MEHLVFHPKGICLKHIYYHLMVLINTVHFPVYHEVILKGSEAYFINS